MKSSVIRKIVQEDCKLTYDITRTPLFRNSCTNPFQSGYSVAFAESQFQLSCTKNSASSPPIINSCHKQQLLIHTVDRYPMVSFPSQPSPAHKTRMKNDDMDIDTRQKDKKTDLEPKRGNGDMELLSQRCVSFLNEVTSTLHPNYGTFEDPIGQWSHGARDLCVS